MNGDRVLNHSIGGLRLAGDIRRGLLRNITNIDNDLTVSFNEGDCLFELELEHRSGSTTNALSEFEVTREDGEEWLGHPAHAVRVKLDWRPFAKDAAICRVHVKTDDPEITARRITFMPATKIELPEAFGTDCLAIPKSGGMRIPEPAREFFKPRDAQTAHWKDRAIRIWREGFQSLDEPEDHYEFIQDLSMGWVDYHCERGGVYLGSHDAAFDQTEAKVIVDRGAKGVALRLIKTINRREADYQTEFAIALHSGDWHRGADLYREFHDRTGRKVNPLPSFMKESPGVMCHYDFKWQDGSVNHRFEDIDTLYEEAVEHGYNELLIAGWNHGGFDNHYPDFSPAAELGTERELTEAVQRIRAKGAKVFFYVNAYSHDADEPNFERSGAAWAAKLRDGSHYEQIFGGSRLVGMCNGSAGWREKLKSNISYVIKTLGADGVYLDQLNVIPKVCHDPAHDHRRSWKLNNAATLHEIRRELGPEYEDKIFLFCEWASDAILSEIDCLLFQTCWFFGLKYSAPELFRYTFPEMAALDMIMPKPWPGAPAKLERAHVKDQFCKMFVTGMLFWTYDHVPGIPGFDEFFKQAIRLRKRAASLLAESRFVDDVAIEECDKGVVAKVFENPDGIQAISVWNKTGKTAKIRPKDLSRFKNVRILTLTGDRTTKLEANSLFIRCPKDDLSVILLSE